MFKETARRIKEGLIASLEGGSLKWLQGYQAPNPLLQNVDPVSLNPTVLPAPAPLSGVKAGTSSSTAGKTQAHSGQKGVPSIPSMGRMDSTNSMLAAEEASGYNFEYATGFLKEGFEELLKCRSVSNLSLFHLYSSSFSDYLHFFEFFF